MILCSLFSNFKCKPRLILTLSQVAFLLALTCLTAEVWAQSNTGLRLTNSTSSGPISRKLPKQRVSSHAQNSISHDRVIQGTHSIVQPASHNDLVIPNALAEERVFDGSEGHQGKFADTSLGEEVHCDAGSEAFSMYDYVTSDKRKGHHHFLLDWSRADLWVGTTSFVNPAGTFTNAAGTAVGQVEGAFGFQEGFNFGSQLPSLFSGQLGSQIGMRFVQSNLDGSSLSDNSRNQMFLTAGLFRRVDYGFQGGAVVDYFHQQWIERVDLLQLRAELSFLFSPVHELGFRLTENGRNSQQTVQIPSTGTTVTSRMRTLDTYRFFARRRFGANSASLAEAQLGTSNCGGVVLGCLLQTPLMGQLGLESSATYFVPKHTATRQFDNQAWSMNISLVWTPGRAFGTCRDYNRPLFEVAGNTSLIQARP